MRKVALPVLVAVTEPVACVRGLQMPEISRLAGETDNTGLGTGVAVPVSVTVLTCGEPWPVAVMVIAPASVPAARGS